MNTCFSEMALSALAGIVADSSEAQLLNTPVPSPPATTASGNFTVLILSHCANALPPRITPALFRLTEVRPSQS